jgi:hypothetical protein
MAIKTTGFARAASWDDIPLGAVAMASRENVISLVLKIAAADGRPGILVLREFAGSSGVAVPFNRPAVYFEAMALEGEFVARPISVLRPHTGDGQIPNGSLAILPTGKAYLRFDGGGGHINYVDLSTGLLDEANGDRVFYDSWCLVRVLDGREEELASFPAA